MNNIFINKLINIINNFFQLIIKITSWINSKIIKNWGINI